MEKYIIIAMSVLCLFLLGSTLFLTLRPAEVIEKETIVKETESIIDESILVALDELKVKVDSLEEFSSKKDEDLLNLTAKELVAKELELKSFMKDIKAFLEDNAVDNKTIESYKDLEIYSTKLKSSKVNASNDEVVIVYEIKLQGFEEGDDELDFKVRLTVEFTVSELVIDDDFDDADVEYEFTEIRFY